MKKPSKMVTCPICGKEVRARGLYGHMKLKDHLNPLNLTRVDGKNADDSSDNSSNTEVKDVDSGNKFPINDHESDYTRVEGNSISDLTEAEEAKRLNFKLTDDDRKKVSRRRPSKKSVDKKDKAEKSMMDGKLKQDFWGILTEDCKTYEPTITEMLEFYRKRTERSLKHWERLKKAQEKYGWPARSGLRPIKRLNNYLDQLHLVFEY